MKAKIFRFLILSSIIVSICSVDFAFADENLGPTFEFVKDYFLLEKGNEWTYLAEVDGNEGELKVDIKEGKRIDGIKTLKIEFSNGEADYVSFTEEGIRRHKYTHANGTSRELFKPKAIIFPRTMSMNISHFDNYFYSEFTKDNIHYRTTDQFAIVTLIGLEDVDVPAGKFKNCLKVIFVEDLKLLNSVGDPLPSTRDIHHNILWFARGIGLVKSSSTYSRAFKGMIETKYQKLELKSAVINGRKIGK